VPTKTQPRVQYIVAASQPLFSCATPLLGSTVLMSSVHSMPQPMSRDKHGSSSCPCSPKTPTMGQNLLAPACWLTASRIMAQMDVSNHTKAAGGPPTACRHRYRRLTVQQHPAGTVPGLMAMELPYFLLTYMPRVTKRPLETPS
jgi:hypothetical protein